MMFLVSTKNPVLEAPGKHDPKTYKEFFYDLYI